MSDDLGWLRASPQPRIDGRTVRLRQWTRHDLVEQLAAIRESADALTKMDAVGRRL